VARGPIDIRIDDGDFRRKMKRLGDKGKDARESLGRFFGWWGTITGTMFRRIGRASKGGTWRGVHWDPMKPQYVRKDGTVVPLGAACQGLEARHAR